jgi:uncharacterized membrane protein
MLHQINIGIHAFIGTLAIIIGIIAVWYNKNAIVHKKWGTYFVVLLSMVVVTGFIGFLFFRKDPFLSMLTILSGYVGYAGFRAVKLKEKKGHTIDIAIAIFSLSLGIVFIWYLTEGQDSWNVSVVLSTLIALAIVTIYDIIKYFFLFSYLKKWWLYEHIYKMISAFSALTSAFAGNVWRDFHPYSQLGPSIIGTFLIAYFIVQRGKMSRRNAEAD